MLGKADGKELLTCDFRERPCPKKQVGRGIREYKRQKLKAVWGRHVKQLSCLIFSNDVRKQHQSVPFGDNSTLTKIRLKKKSWSQLAAFGTLVPEVKLKSLSCVRLFATPWTVQNTGLSLLQGIFPTQGSNPGLPHCRRILYHLNHKVSPLTRGWTWTPRAGRHSLNHWITM